ncbi:uncharacterized protein HMPREF1541_08240 [Cyphellophora europaea CBS 101466]|uniref:F-box domain-containing protein n=1 Tax=Cyphellophora europaea (strain CBS 101466) TaxID=1220924 RepID=W2RND6_CYPE1|nr:uncharacterized protein HMPREF1541_08240 [Cyphellophora europaea CBS 101466]ETN37249.1 hypothetical protein HMPREF1541_08240 [Cyphellophora europaea CBS 101466]
MNTTACLMNLPSEIRELILLHLFDTPQLIHLRSPAHCRLRASRIDKDDASGALSVARLLRQEAVPIYFTVNTLVFRHTSDVLEFMSDVRISQGVKDNISRIAVDDGDVMDLGQLKDAQLSVIDSTFTHLPRLQVLEFRAWARTDNAHYLGNLNSLAVFWETLEKDGPPTTSKAALSAYMNAMIVNSYYLSAKNAMRKTRVNITIKEAQEKYTAGRQNLPDNVSLKVCNMVLSKAPGVLPVLGGAKEAVQQRMKVAGATHIKDDNVLERLSWDTDEWHWIDPTNPRSLGERYR